MAAIITGYGIGDKVQIADGGPVGRIYGIYVGVTGGVTYNVHTWFEGEPEVLPNVAEWQLELVEEYAESNK